MSSVILILLCSWIAFICMFVYMSITNFNGSFNEWVQIKFALSNPTCTLPWYLCCSETDHLTSKFSLACYRLTCQGTRSYVQCQHAKIRKKIFLLSVHGSLLHTKKKKKKYHFKLYITHGGFVSTWGHNFYMGMQKGSRLEIWSQGILIHTIELKIWHFKILHMFV